MEVKAKQLGDKVNVSSETGILGKVLIHRPDEGIEKVTPSRALDLLYEDIVYLPKMREEHDVFIEALSLFVRKQNVLDVQDLLTDILEIPEIKKQLIDLSCKLENISPGELRSVYPLDSQETARLLITGSYGKMNVFNPLPNFIFTRDIGVVINDFLLVGCASKTARRRESLISSYIFNHHPLFKELSAAERVIELSSGNSSLELSIEGGDVMMFGNDHLIIATSERTAEAAVSSLINTLFDKKAVEKITVVNLPRDRYCMHLDTVFTKISDKECVAFEPLIMKEGKMPAVVHISDGKPEKFSSLKSVLLNDNPWMDFIPCGEGLAPYDEREQWTDGCNLFAVKNGVAFTYDRNLKTNEALKDHGFKITGAADFIEEYKKGKKKTDSVERTIITIPSSELSRARGGPHCMTMPLLRS